MLKRLINFLKNNYPESNINEYLDAKYIYLEKDKLKKIALAIKNKELIIKPASNCTAQLLLFHFNDNIILLKKTNKGYTAEFAWETDFIAVHSIRQKAKGFYFIKFNFDDNYKIELLTTDKSNNSQIRNIPKEQEIIKKIMPVLKGFISAIS